MKLTDTDYMNIANEITEGEGYVEYEKGDEMLHIEYDYEVDGYVEDDYFNGTGAFVETSRDLRIKDASVYDDDGRSTPFSLDENRLERLIV